MRYFSMGRCFCVCMSLCVLALGARANENNKPSETVTSYSNVPGLLNDTVPKRVTGKVTSEENGAPLANVSITILQTKKGTESDAAGNFVIYAKDGDDIQFSYVGRTPKVITFHKQATLNVTLVTGTERALSEVVVTGYQNIDKRKFSGAAVGLKAEDVKIDGMTDVSRMLEGRAAGVSVQNVSSTFGTAPKVRIRGATSINGDNKPLWVVDGVVLEDVVNISNDQLSSGDAVTLLGSSVAGLNVNDIESFDILKDAAAAALYGARAMNGVIVITTKKGRVGRPIVSYVGNFSTQLKPTYNSYNIMNSADQMAVYTELYKKGMLNSTISDGPNTGVYGKMYDEINTYNETNGKFGVENTVAGRAAFLQRYVGVNTDWFNVLFKNSFIQEHNLSISSGTDKSQTYFSTNFYYDNGWTIADNVKRYTLNFKNTYTLNNKLTAGFSTVGSLRQQRAPGTLQRAANAVEGSYDRDFDINPFSYAINTSRTITPYDSTGQLEYFKMNYAPFNIVNELKNNYIDLTVLDIRLQGELSYKFAKNFRYEFVGALRFVKSTTEQQVRENSNMANAYRAAGTSTVRQNNKFLYRDPDNPDAEPVVVLPYGGFYNRQEDQLANYEIRNSLNYNKTFNEVHSLNVLVGQQIKYANRQSANNTGYGYQYDQGGVPFIDYRIIKQALENSFPYYGMVKTYDRFAAFYATAGYSYNRRFNLTGTARYDGSNQLGESKTARWLPTWSVSGSWNIDQESFMKNVDFVDFLTLRASYGLTASMGPATNSSIVLKNMQTRRPYLSEVESVILQESLENEDLTWEKLYTGNIGVDATMFNRRLNITLDLYRRRSFDLISIVKTSGIGGEAYKAANYADMKSHGVEFLVGGDIIRQNDWGWKTNLTFGYNENEITNAKNDPIIFDLVKAEGGNKQGYPVNGLFSLDYKGLQPRTGVPQFVNEDGDISPSVYLQSDNTQHLVYEGPVDPKITGGFSNTVRYKAFSVNVFLTYQQGNRIRLYPAFKQRYSDLDAMPKEFYDRWAIPGDQGQTNVPSIADVYEQYLLGGSYPYNNYNYSTQRVANGSFVRLKTVSLTYQLPAATLQKAKLNNLSITAQAINPWLIYSDSKLKGQDPEFFNAGGVAQPIQKQFTLSLKVGI
ncbi:SusC/RagA family TonB-linked outer membrane protein [Pinibacter soli]|uniref:SusC/RagA family TonB-linked outer membrane protein n=1 Tax=Pinibacter soli TaxID=3044211 RepID=A0ABT6RHV4_9BACT|nr:SusC/RagA family TonB-linked outer membrane protein [Pinibacter soli]MDI3322149.1 SusC/RagA family TonB-linked outer membrane protein [Pinibacter soli]